MLSLIPRKTVIDTSPEPALDLSLSTYPSPKVVLGNNGDTSTLEKYLSEYVAEKGGSLINVKNRVIEEG